MRGAKSNLTGLLGALLLVMAAGPALASARLIGVAPARAGEQLACRVTASGLPDERQLQSMRSGLVAAVELELAVVDAEGRVAVAHSLSLRLGFDLWEEVFSVSGAGAERRFRSLEELRAHLADLPPFTLMPLASLAESGRYQVRAGLLARPVANDERERVGNLIAGEPRGEPGRSDRQEASVSLGRLIRFFYQGTRDDRDGQEAASAWFRRQEVPDEAH